MHTDHLSTEERAMLAFVQRTTLELQKPAETKNDPETEVTVSTALAAFWSAVLNRHPGNAVLEGDVLTRLEIAAYDAVEEWIAENPPQPQTVPLGWEPAPQWAKDAKDQDSRQS